MPSKLHACTHPTTKQTIMYFGHSSGVNFVQSSLAPTAGNCTIVSKYTKASKCSFIHHGLNQFRVRSRRTAIIRRNNNTRCSTTTVYDNIEDSGNEEQDNHQNQNSLSFKPKKQSKWSVAIAASIVYALHTTLIYTIPISLLHPMKNSLNLSISEITRPILLFRIIHVFLLFPSSYVMSSVGLYRCVRFFIPLTALLAPLLSVATSLPQLLVLQTAFAITKVFAGLSPMLNIISDAFHDDDGDDSKNNTRNSGFSTAIAIVLGGYSLAGFVVPTLLGKLTQIYGWRIASFIISSLYILIAVPVSLVYLRNPKTLSQQQQSRNNTNHNNLNLKNVFTFEYLTIFLCVASFSFSMHIVTDHLIPFLTDDLQLPFHVSTRYLSLFNLVSLIFKLCAGPIGDRFNKSKLIVIYGLIGTLSAFLLFNISSFSSLFMFQPTTNLIQICMFILFYAACYSTVFTISSSILSDLGKNEMMMRSNLNLTAFFAAGSLGSWLAAKLRTYTGTYRWPFIFHIIAYASVTVCGILKFYIESLKKKKKT